jgi:hypothetical protein
MLRGTRAEDFDELAAVAEVITVWFGSILEGPIEELLVYMGINNQIIEMIPNFEPEHIIDQTLHP